MGENASFFSVSISAETNVAFLKNFFNIKMNYAIPIRNNS